jgi:hypothetical protein
MATIKHPKELKQVALSIRNIAASLAPYKTGNLRNTLNSYNTPDRMIQYGPNGSANIIFFVGPPGADYGKYWNKPYGYPPHKGTTVTIRKKYPQHFDYGENALKDASIKKSIKDYAKALGVQIGTDLRESVRKELGSK